MSELTTTQTDTGLSIMGGLTAADLATLDVAKVEALLGMQERIDARNAERSLADALARFQESCPRVHKGKKGGQGNYAPFDAVMEVAKPHLGANGLSVSFDTEATEGGVIATCHVMHRDGARFSRKASVPIDTAGRMNVAQQMGSAISYAKRYAMTAALNIVTTDEDDDGAAAGTQAITREEADAMLDLLNQLPKDKQSLVLKFGGVDCVDDYPSRLYGAAMKKLRATVAKEGGAE